MLQAVRYISIIIACEHGISIKKCYQVRKGIGMRKIVISDKTKKIINDVCQAVIWISILGIGLTVGVVSVLAQHAGDWNNFQVFFGIAVAFYMVNAVLQRISRPSH